MNKVWIAYVHGKITRDEMYRYQNLHRKLMLSSFVEMEDTEDWKEFRMLNEKIYK
jgi:hypothetical protein